MEYFLSEWLWAIFFLLLLLREVYLGYKYGTQEPLKSKKGLQRQLYYLIAICFVCWIIFELTVTSEKIFDEYNVETVEEAREFNRNLSASTLDFYKEKFMTHEWEVPINLEKKVSFVQQNDSYIYEDGGTYVQENEKLINTMKITVLQSPYFFNSRKLIYKVPREIIFESKEENLIKIVIPVQRNLGTLNVVNNIAFNEGPWLLETKKQMRNRGVNFKYLFIIVEVPIGTQFRGSDIQYLKERYIR